MNRDYFFARVRESVFGGKLGQSQVDGMNKIIDYAETKHAGMDPRFLAYILATAAWETARKMQPITEMGSAKYLMSKPYWPWIGRGLVQITWERNYKKYGISDPDKALTWPVALHVCFDGMLKGMFTGKKLSDYIAGSHCDFIGARRIINGTDKARLIAGYANSFLEALTQAKEPADPTLQPAPKDATTGKPMSQSAIVQAGGALGTIGAIAPAVEAAKSVQEAVDTSKSLWDTALSAGPWVLLVIACGVLAYVIYLQRKKHSVEDGI